MLIKRKIIGATSLAEVFDGAGERGFHVPFIETLEQCLDRHADPAKIPAGSHQALRGLLGSILMQPFLQVAESSHRHEAIRIVELLNRTRSGNLQIQSVEARDTPIVVVPTLGTFEGHVTMGSLIPFRDRSRTAVPSILSAEWKRHEVVAIVKTDMTDYAASFLQQELRHLAQKENMANRPSGQVISFDRSPTGGWGDVPLIGSMMEADAQGRQLITAYEFYEGGMGNALKQFAGGREKASRFMTTLFNLLRQGVELHSPDMKLALFDRWMTDHTGLRPAYERSLVAEGAKNPSAHWTPGITLKSQDLVCIGAERDGSSYLEGIDLLNPRYTQRLATLSAENATQPAVDWSRICAPSPRTGPPRLYNSF